MSSLRKTRPETKSTAINENSNINQQAATEPTKLSVSRRTENIIFLNEFQHFVRSVIKHYFYASFGTTPNWVNKPIKYEPRSFKTNIAFKRQKKQQI